MRMSAVIGKYGAYMLIGFAYGVAVCVPGIALIMASISGKELSDLAIAYRVNLCGVPFKKIFKNT